jgi:hypothetical protein
MLHGNFAGGAEQHMTLLTPGGDKCLINFEHSLLGLEETHNNAIVHLMAL